MKPIFSVKAILLELGKFLFKWPRRKISFKFFEFFRTFQVICRLMHFIFRSFQILEHFITFIDAVIFYFNSDKPIKLWQKSSKKVVKLRAKHVSQAKFIKLRVSLGNFYHIWFLNINFFKETVLILWKTLVA